MRSMAVFLYTVMKNRLVVLLDAMEKTKPDLVRPIVFVCLNDSKRSSQLESVAEATSAVGDEVAAGLACLHDRRIVHGDLKGNNIVVDYEGI